MTCKNCIHCEICEAYSKRDTWETLHCAEECVCFADRSEWVHLPSEDYKFTIRGDLARAIIIANCRAAESERTSIEVIGNIHDNSELLEKNE